MPITLGSLIEIVNRGTVEGQAAFNAWQYQVDGSAFLVEPVQIAEAWWNHVKETFRGIPTSNYTTVFTSITIRELNNPVGDFAVYSVPLAERGGTRAPGTQDQGLPSFIAAGVQLTVGTRLTRPGQKRFAGFVEQDQFGGQFAGPPLAAIDAHMAVMTEPMILGAPAATIVLNPIVTGKNAEGEVDRNQPILGWLTNPFVTSQNSRKIGRGI